MNIFIEFLRHSVECQIMNWQSMKYIADSFRISLGNVCDNEIYNIHFALFSKVPKYSFLLKFAWQKLVSVTFCMKIEEELSCLREYHGSGKCINLKPLPSTYYAFSLSTRQIIHIAYSLLREFHKIRNSQNPKVKMYWRISIRSSGYILVA